MLDFLNWDVVAYVGLLIVAFYMLSKGSDWFVDGAAGIATKLRIPQLIIGLTIVAMGTSAPEAAVSISSAFSPNGADITISNIVGSNILNVLIILGISSVITSLAVDKNTFIIDIPVTILATVLLMIFGIDAVILWWEAVIMLVIFIAYIGFLIYKAMKERKNVTNSLEPLAEEEPVKEISTIKAIFLAIVGLAMIVLGSQGAVESATYLAAKMGVDDKLIGLTVVALGTSLPELFTSVKAALKGNADIAIGNVVGSNIFNLLLVVGLTGAITPVPFAPSFMIDSAVALGAMLLLLFASLKGKKLGRVGGVLMLLSYAGYFVYLLFTNGLIG
ncbi:MAG: calcium/sodium antiporter [Clostridia bacterium]|nr:calcium/sodium antiporter [Clostridia bacterium]